MTAFLSALLARCEAYRPTACLTLTAIHPDGQHRTPSRHIPLNRPDLLGDAKVKLLETNRLGWGAFVAVGLRRHGLTRFRRGGEADILALPAVFVDVDDPSSETLGYLRAMQPLPSCITFTGGGYHAFWWLDEPMTDLAAARHVLRALQRVSGGDPLSVVNSLRFPGSVNNKPHRNNARCRIVELYDRYHPLEAFAPLLPCPTTKPQAVPPRRRTDHLPSTGTLNPDLLRVVSNHLSGMGYVQQGDWLSGPCLYPAQHRHDDTHHSFGFNTRSGYGNCFRCGSILLKDICITLGIQPANYGGIFVQMKGTYP